MNDILILRKHLHQNPELSGFEFNTAQTIAEFLKKYTPNELLENLGDGTGIIAVYRPTKEVKQTIMFRCELDALPIQEINEFEHKSGTPEVSHKCGHDGHMTVMCSLAKKLSEQKMEHTKVLLLFQPAEENGEGAVAIYNDPRFKELNPDMVFALHNLPGYDHHDIVVKNHTFTCAVNSIIIKLHGRTAHAGEPAARHIVRGRRQRRAHLRVTRQVCVTKGETIQLRAVLIATQSKHGKRVRRAVGARNELDTRNRRRHRREITHLLGGQQRGISHVQRFFRTTNV